MSTVTIPAQDARPLPKEQSATLFNLLLAVTGAAAALSVIGWVMDPRQFYSSYLASYTFTLTLALGSLFWVMIHHLADAGWSVVVRRRFENYARALPVWLVMFVPVGIGVMSGSLYQWTNYDEVQTRAEDALKNAPEAEHTRHLVREFNLLNTKYPYLNLPFFLVRLAVYFTVWITLAMLFSGLSLRQDETGDVELTTRMQTYAGVGILCLALTATFAAFDLLMSLTYTWYSTIFGVYFWAGSIWSAMALQTVTTLVLRSQGYLRTSVTAEHTHDMGKLMFGLTVFWTYIAFAQYFLIWYANMEEETQFFIRRQAGQNPWPFLYDPAFRAEYFQTHTLGDLFDGWYWLTVALIFGHFVIPFFCLLPKTTKRIPLVLGAICVWIVFFHFVDHYWLVMPTLHTDGWRPHWLDATCAVTLLGTLLLVGLWNMREHPLLPIRDPRLAESLRFENFL
jgi:hypothetical protein